MADKPGKPTESERDLLERRYLAAKDPAEKSWLLRQLERLAARETR